MPFQWLDDFQRSLEKPENYAEKTLAAYRLGMKAGGALRGVRVEVGENCCAAAQALPEGEEYSPETAPHLPLAGCPFGRRCRCSYRPVMTYQEPGR